MRSNTPTDGISDVTTTEPTILSDAQVAEIKARWSDFSDHADDIPALCQTVRALRAERDNYADEVNELSDQLAAVTRERDRLLSEIEQPKCNDCGSTLGDNWCANCAGRLMRDKCVEKVKELRDDYERRAAECRKAFNIGGEISFKKMFVAATDVINALSSLTLDQVEQKQ